MNEGARRMTYERLRSMADMMSRLDDPADGAGSVVRTDDGWWRQLGPGLGYRYEYDAKFAKGGFDFYRLGNGICVALIDMVANQPMPRRYSSSDYLTLTAVLDGDLRLSGGGGIGGELSNGFCTVYSMLAGDELETVYSPGDHLRWVTVYLERTTLFHVTGLTAKDLPPSIVDFALNGGSLPCRKVPLTRAASLAAHQMLEAPFPGSFRHAFLTGKALELACHILFNLSRAVEKADEGQFSAEDHRRLQHAMRLIRTNLDQPLNVHEIADEVGLTRQRLQQGFRMVYGDTVGRVRDKMRMELALELIRDSKTPMIEIALETGYEHPASFTRAFKAAFGVSPIQMRYLAHDELRVKNLRRKSPSSEIENNGS